MHDKSDSEIESEYAKNNDALFWRNGSPFGVKKKINMNRKDVQTMGEYFLDDGEAYTIEELLQKLEIDLGYDRTRGKRLITDCEVNGFITCVGNGIYTR